MQDQIEAAYLRIKREILFEPVFPFHGKPKKVHIKLPGFFFGKDTDDRDGRRKMHSGLQLIMTGQPA